MAIHWWVVASAFLPVQPTLRQYSSVVGNRFLEITIKEEVFRSGEQSSLPGLFLSCPACSKNKDTPQNQFLQ